MAALADAVFHERDRVALVFGEAIIEAQDLRLDGRGDVGALGFQVLESGFDGLGALGEFLQFIVDEFLRGETGLHIRVRRGELEDRGERCDGPRYTLAFEAWRDGPERFEHIELAEAVEG